MRTRDEFRDAFRNEFAGFVAHAFLEGYRIGCGPAELTNLKMQQCGKADREHLIEASKLLDRMYEFLADAPNGPPKDAPKKKE